MRQYSSLKQWYPSTILYIVTSQMALILRKLCVYLSEGIWRSKGTVPLILNLAIRWLVIIVMPLQLYPQWKSPSPHWKEAWWALEMLWRREKSLAPTRNQTMIPQMSSPEPSHCADWGMLAPFVHISKSCTFVRDLVIKIFRISHWVRLMSLPLQHFAWQPCWNCLRYGSKMWC